MYRLMQPEDKPAVLALWQSQRRESEEGERVASRSDDGRSFTFCILHNRTIKLLVLMRPQTHKLHTGRTVMTLA